MIVLLIIADMDHFPPEANAVLEELVHNQMLQAQVVAYEEDGVPYLQLYQRLPGQNVSIETLSCFKLKEKKSIFNNVS